VPEIIGRPGANIFITFTEAELLTLAGVIPGSYEVEDAVWRSTDHGISILLAPDPFQRVQSPLEGLYEAPAYQPDPDPGTGHA
jgi:hypothetical protein